ncbi:hypothetical protein JR316_0008897 [Psilocybe cubensis]|uniref:Protein kinase domain-containing protein n=2 Tax=Psilocybe cubensis TaxID=181762 RepID=A0A8H7XUE1_PSICU|nr:hypothetical protein JR316_0008897 [Psilocybe cubensis]KAH9478442.1 hypothetical protein JR316_0008897 [Psilocybe cubensis]
MSDSLMDAEVEWVKLQPVLRDSGYMLRPRYHPSWKPSWQKRRNFYKSMKDCEDSIVLETPAQRHNVIDAVRVKDGLKVVIKRSTFEHDNISLLQHLNSDEMRADPRNNAVPLLEVISVPISDKDNDSMHIVLLVMPLLAPLVSGYIPFRHFREVTHALNQIFQGVEFLHDNGIAHRQMPRDACMLNFMMDPTDVIPGGFHHSKQYAKPDGKTSIDIRDRCTVPTIKYYIIDFETASYFPPNSLCIGRYGQEKAAPEFSNTIPFDPFKLDVYQLGMLVHRLIQRYDGLELLVPLRDSMTQKEPKLRPNVSQALKMLYKIISSLDEDSLSQDLRQRDIFYELISEFKRVPTTKESVAQPETLPLQKKTLHPQQDSVPLQQGDLSPSSRRSTHVCKRGLSTFTKLKALIFSL